MTEDPQDVAESFARSFPAVYLRFHRRDEKSSQLPTASRAVLQHLALSGPVTVGELCDHLDRAQSVVSDIVAHLELKGLVERQDDPNDRRRRMVWLSPFARNFLERDQEILSVDLLRSAIEMMAPADRAALVQGMQALLAADDAVRARPALPTHRKPPSHRKPPIHPKPTRKDGK
ncbi:MAG TPA: MarR family winged helix-turn-helix transcriptional regulator [Acidimicrobiales bacterium]|nr:MarR family winged helix-turn-helix transcriptional regulator [Acidimicrobiales bacterium]